MTGIGGVARPVIATRNQLFSALFLLSTLNAFVGVGVRQVEGVGLLTALYDLFGISAILWVALAAGLRIMSEDPGGACRRADLLLAVAVFLAALLPVAAASSFALTAVAAWAIIGGTAGSPLRRAAFVFLAMAGALLWGRLVLAVWSHPLLDLDALFVGHSLGVEHQGNVIWSGDRVTRIIVEPGCSSMQGMSLALVMWTMINQYFRVPFRLEAALCCLAALAVTVGINVLRIAAMLRWPEHLEEIHHGWGFQLSMWATLAGVVAICLFGARREIFARP
jgi:exosortase/archaeosortase family protein